MNIIELSAYEMASKIKNGELTSVQVVKAHLDRIDEKEKDINAFITLTGDEALERAKLIDEKIKNGESVGSLAGVPIAIKDNISVRGTRMTCASKMLENYIPPFNAEVIDKILAEDGIIIGKTNLDEFAMGSSTELSHFGSTKNPIDESRVAGGSSGGSAAAVKANMVPISLGSDTGGSIRQPAAFTGLVGFTPSYGSVSRYGLASMSNTMDQIGTFGRDIRDAVLLLSVIEGEDEKDSTSNLGGNPVDFKEYLKDENDYRAYTSKLKIALPKEFYNYDYDERVKAQVENAIEEYRKMGATVEEVSIPSLDHVLSIYNVISNGELSANLARYDGVRYGYSSKGANSLDELYVKNRTEGFGDEVKRRIILGTYYLSRDGREYHEKALKLRQVLIEDIKKIFADYDLILSPTTPILPFKFGEKEDPLSMYMSDLFTVGVNLSGICSMSIPCGEVEGLPVGLQLVGDRFREDVIIKAGLAFEGGMKSEL